MCFCLLSPKNIHDIIPCSWRAFLSTNSPEAPIRLSQKRSFLLFLSLAEVVITHHHVPSKHAVEAFHYSFFSVLLALSVCLSKQTHSILSPSQSVRSSAESFAHEKNGKVHKEPEEKKTLLVKHLTEFLPRPSGIDRTTSSRTTTMLGALDVHRAVLPSQRPPSPPSHPHPHSRQPMSEYVHHDAVGPSPYEDSTSNTTSNGNSRRDDYLARFGGREPLQESTGNVQHHHGHHQHHSHYPYGQRALPSLSAASSASCTPVLSHALSSIPAPPILPTQALGSTGLQSSSSGSQQDQHHHSQQQQHQGGGIILSAGHNAAAATAAALVAAGGTSALRMRRRQLQHQTNIARAHSRHSKNPIYLSPEFCQYRTKQKDKDEQKWPDILEDAFLDGTFLPFSCSFSSALLPSSSSPPCIPVQLAFSASVRTHMVGPYSSRAKSI